MLKPEVVFFGSGPVAAKSLELLTENFSVVAVVTKPKPEHHKADFPVISLSKKLNLPVFTVSNKKELSELIATKPFKTEVAILIDFGIIVSQDVIDYFPKGIINSHFSLLPEWRGADPITFAILTGQKKTGVSLMLLVEAMDEGPVISCDIQELVGTETTPLLTEKLIKLSYSLLKKEVPRYMSDETHGLAQSELIIAMGKIIPDYPQTPTYSRKLTKDDGELDFKKSAIELEREIRAFIEWPKSRTTIGGIDVIITKAHVESTKNNKQAPGKLEILKETGTLKIACKDGYLSIDSIKPAGKNEMTAKEFLAGYGNKL